MIALKIAELLAEQLEEVSEERLLMAAHRIVNGSAELWIDVVEKWPFVGDWVLCLGAKGGLFVGKVYDDELRKGNKIVVNTPTGMQRARYWMPAPERKVVE